MFRVGLKGSRVLFQPVDDMLDLVQRLRCITERGEMEIHLVHHGEEEPAHLPLRLVLVVENTAALDPAASTSEEQDGQSGRVVTASQHGGAEQEHGVIEQGAFAFLDGVELSGDVSDLFEEELVHLEPVGGVAVGEQVVDHVIDAEVGESE
ncbi:MAG: hypothetical protein RI897_907 [Verrucomicrobiota bacterium]